MDPHAPTPPARSSSAIQGACLAICILLAVTSIPAVFVRVSNYADPSPTSTESFKFDEQTKLAIENRFETGRYLLQTALGLIAVSWGVIAIGDDKAKKMLGSGESKAMFLLGSVCLVFSALAYMQLTDTLSHYLQVSTRISSKPLPDLGHRAVSGRAGAQVWGIIAGAACKGLSIMSSIWFPKNPASADHEPKTTTDVLP